MFQLPRLTWDLDCAPIGYPGLVVTCLLNPTFSDYKFPWEEIENAEVRARERAATIQDKPWISELFFMYGRMFERVTFPATMTDSGKAETIEMPDGKAVYELMQTVGFDQNIVVWANRRLSRERAERLEAELKNSPKASGEPALPSEKE